MKHTNDLSDIIIYNLNIKHISLVGVGEIVQPIKYLICKHRDASLLSRTHIK